MPWLRRSPWWGSLLIVLGFVLASLALLPKAYVPFGVMGAFPFLASQSREQPGYSGRHLRSGEG